jgi:hypothetical protein
VSDAADAAISFSMVGAVEDVWGELGCQIVPVHDAGAELALRSHSRLELAIAVIINYNRVQMV